MTQNYKYNGKKYNDAFGLNIYEMDWRQYDPAISRWTVMDRVMHHDFSPYSAFDNNLAFNIYVGTWNEYLKKGLDSYIGRHLMHEYGHYLQEKYMGTKNYYSKVVPASSESFQNGQHNKNWTEIQASTLVWIYFNNPKNFDNENNIHYNSISPYGPGPISFQLIQLLEGQYLNHPDYKP